MPHGCIRRPHAGPFRYSTPRLPQRPNTVQPTTSEKEALLNYLKYLIQEKGIFQPEGGSESPVPPRDCAAQQRGWRSGFQLPASGFQAPASGFRPPASGLRLLASGFQLPASGFQPRASGLRLLASGFKPRASGFQLPASPTDGPLPGRKTTSFPMGGWGLAIGGDATGRAWADSPRNLSQNPEVHSSPQ